MMLIAGCLSQDEAPLSLGSSKPPLLEPSWSHRTARARTIYGTMVAMPCEAAVRIEAG